MKQLYSFLIFSFLLTIVSFNTVLAQQSFKKNRYYSIGGCLNAMNYVGDLDPGPSFASPSIKFTRYNVGLTGLYRYSPLVSFRGTLSTGEIQGSDAQSANYAAKNVNRLYRNLSFKSQIYEVKADIVIDLIGNRGKYTKRPDYTPYVFAGVAYFHMDPTAVDPSGHTVHLHKLHTEGQGLPGGPKQYSLNQIALPVGAGFRYKLSKQLDLAFEIGWRFTTTDYMDDVSGKYYDKGKLQAAYGKETVIMSDRSAEAYHNNSELAASADNRQGNGTPGSGLVTDANGYTSISSYGQAGNQRGSINGRKDMYIITGFHLTYIIPEKVVCPKFR
jgi:hypothetical protein